MSPCSSTTRMPRHWQSVQARMTSTTPSRYSLLELLRANKASRALVASRRASAALRSVMSVQAPTHSRMLPSSCDYRHAPDGEIPVLAIVPAHAIFGLIQRARRHRVLPDGLGAFQVVRMERAGPAPTFGFVVALPGKGAPGGDILQDLALRVGRPDDLGGGSDERAIAGLILAQLPPCAPPPAVPNPR